jgi:LysR family glycine cleavage system transcriptional activator
MPRRLPSLNALKAFEAAARHESFTRAAEELCVTQGAVSHQVKALEGELGMKLFQRTRRRLLLSAVGRDYLDVVRDAFDRLDAGTQRLQRRERSGVLTVSTSPNFAAKWLVHRLGAFAAAHPGIDLRVGATLEHVDFVRDAVDLAIRHGEGDWPGLHVTRLCAEELFPVCSARLVREGPRLRRPADLARATLLRQDRNDAWGQWLAAAGVDGIDLARGPAFNQASLAIDAAVDGQGVALARTALAIRDLLSGRLVRPFAQTLPASFAYYVVCPRAVAAQPKVAAFRDWLLAEAAADTSRLDALLAGPQIAPGAIVPGAIVPGAIVPGAIVPGATVPGAAPTPPRASARPRRRR